GRIRLDPEPVELEPFLNDAMRVVSGRADDKHLKLTARMGHGIRLVADNRLLKQIVLNLLSNAVKFTPEGGRITIRARATSGWVSIAIADTGIGIPEEALARLGRPFEQVESQLTKSHQGSGLGLAIAKSLTELHHGTIRIRSTPGTGTMVVLRLPIDRTSLRKHENAEAAGLPTVYMSLQRDAGVANDLTPLGDFDFDPIRELIRCTGDRIEAKREQAVVEL